MRKVLLLPGLAILLGVAGLAGGCSADENPVTPEKMNEIRRQEGNERANFQPDASKPKPGY